VAGGEPAPTRYRFGPLQRRGLVAGWRGGQIGAVACALVVGVGVVRATASPVGVGVALAALAVGVGVATWPIAGRTAEEWAPDVFRHVAARGRRPLARGGPFSGVELIGVDVGTRRAGILHDRRHRTFTAVLAASDPGFVLLGEDDKVRRVHAWSGVLASLARDGSNVHRVQWLERVMPGDGPACPVAGADTGAVLDPARASYQALVAVEAHETARHEVFLALSVHGGRAGRAVKAAGGGDAGGCALVLREVAALRRRLVDASVDAGVVLAPEALSAVVRGSYGTSVPLRRTTPDPWPWPMGVTAHWGSLRADDTWHATYWVAEWPRTDAGPDFLGPLLLSSEVRRTMSVVMEPLGPILASRKVEQARTADIADAELRRRGGFLATARRRREEEILARREVELADGHAQYRFSGYVTVTASDDVALEEACGRVEQAAGQTGLELRRCYGDQGNAFLCTLPLGRGLT
jgi:Putative type VII ESX secretion system translocon, EccE